MNDIHVTLTGNVAAPPRQHTFPDGSRVTSLKIASTSRYFDRENQQWRNGETTYFGVRCFRGLADNVAQSIRLGQPVIVQGRLRIREFTHEGERRFMPEVEAGSLGHDLRWGLGSFSKPQRGGPVPALGSAERSELDRETSDWAMSGGVPVESRTLAGDGVGDAPDDMAGVAAAASFGAGGEAVGGLGADGAVAGKAGAGGEVIGVTWVSGAPAGVGAGPVVVSDGVSDIVEGAAGIAPHVVDHGFPEGEPAQEETSSRRRRGAVKGGARRVGTTAASDIEGQAEGDAVGREAPVVVPGDEVPWPTREHVAA